MVVNGCNVELFLQGQWGQGLKIFGEEDLATFQTCKLHMYPSLMFICQCGGQWSET